MDLTKIRFLQPQDKVEEFVKGWSGDKTFIIERGTQKFFLKLICKNANNCDFLNFEIYKKLQVSYPQIIEFGELNSQTKYYISEFINARDFGDIIDSLNDNFIFNTAHSLGKQQLNISNFFGTKISTVENENVLFKHYDEATAEHFDLLNKYKNQLQPIYLNKKMYSDILSDISILKQSFQNELIYYCHDDCMPNNFMLDNKNNIWTIDIEGSQYDFFAKKLRGYIQHMFHKNEKEKLIIFFRGFISGFFENEIPNNLAKQIAYIYLVDMLEICRDSLKKNNLKQFCKRCDLLINSWKKGPILKQCENLF